jgi:PAS domain S-box-containing protein
VLQVSERKWNKSRLFCEKPESATFAGLRLQKYPAKGSLNARTLARRKTSRVRDNFIGYKVRHLTGDELQRSEAYLTAGQRLSHTGSWALNLSSGKISWSQETFLIFGFEPPVPAERKIIGIEDFLQRIHPEDRPAIERGIDSASVQTKSYEVEYRILLSDGSIRHVHEVVYPVSNDSGEVVERYGVVMDVTERKQAEEALRKSEKHFRSLFENMLNAAAYLKIHFDQDRPVDFTYLDVNKAFENQTGFKNLAGKSASNAFPGLHKSDAELFERFGRVALTGEPDQFETYVEALGRWHSVAVYSPHREHVVVVFDDITERKGQEEQLRQSLGQLRSLAARVQRAREDEGARVAREIHDELGQALTAIKMELSSLVHDLPAERKRQSKDILELVDGTIQSMRRICTELRPAILDDLGLMAALEWAAGEFAARSGTRCRLDLLPDEIVINQECTVALFRIFQETLTNVARHANATEVNVRLAKEDGKLALEVHDNGKGVSEERSAARGSLGILGMRERALLVGGELTITGGLGKGTTVRVRIPETPPAPPKDDK